MAYLNKLFMYEKQNENHSAFWYKSIDIVVISLDWLVLSGIMIYSKYHCTK